jgi:hypothetical protein
LGDRVEIGLVLLGVAAIILAVLVGAAVLGEEVFSLAMVILFRWIMGSGKQRT